MMNTDSRLTLWLTVAFLSLSPDLRADDAKPRAPESSTRGVILSTALGRADKDSLLGVLTIQAARGSRLYGVRMASASRFEMFGDSPTPANTDYSVLYGWLRKRGKGYSSVSVGLSSVSAVRRGSLLHSANCFLCSSEYEKVVTRTLGIPFEAKDVFSGKGGGVGLGVFGNLNADASFIGLGVTLELGSLR